MDKNMLDFLRTTDAKFYAILISGVTVFLSYKGLNIEASGIKVKLGQNVSEKQYL